MTREQIDEALKRACRHLVLLRVQDVETQEYEDTWWCDFCETEFDLHMEPLILIRGNEHD